jgi:hypothetical protein
MPHPDYVTHSPPITSYKATRPNTSEEIARARRVVCGARSTKDAEDAKKLLDALGLLESEQDDG